MQRGEDDSDALPFVSRPKAVKVTKAQPGNAKATTVSGAVSSYDEMQDEDTEVEADDPGPESTLEGDTQHQAYTARAAELEHPPTNRQLPDRCREAAVHFEACGGLLL